MYRMLLCDETHTSGAHGMQLCCMATAAERAAAEAACRDASATYSCPFCVPLLPSGVGCRAREGEPPEVAYRSVHTGATSRRLAQWLDVSTAVQDAEHARALVEGGAEVLVELEGGHLRRGRIDVAAPADATPRWVSARVHHATGEPVSTMIFGGRMRVRAVVGALA